MHSRGFSLIELMMALALGVILLVLAGPNYAVWTADAQIRNATESIASGMRLAHAEAVKRNTQVDFILDPTPATGGWQVDVVGVGVVASGTFSEAATRAQFTTTPSAATTVRFNGFGGIVNDTEVPAPPLPVLTAIAITHYGSVSGTRPLAILVGGGRSGIKICDPAVTDVTSPRYCNP